MGHHDRQPLAETRPLIGNSDECAVNLRLVSCLRAPHLPIVDDGPTAGIEPHRPRAASGVPIQTRARAGMTNPTHERITLMLDLGKIT